jgi:hypothetical protein
MHRIVLHSLSSSLETENEITRVVATKINTDKTSPQVVKVDDTVDEEQTINYLSSICYSLNSSYSHSLNDSTSSEHLVL